MQLIITNNAQSKEASELLLQRLEDALAALDGGAATGTSAAPRSQTPLTAADFESWIKA